MLDRSSLTPPKGAGCLAAIGAVAWILLIAWLMGAF